MGRIHFGHCIGCDQPIRPPYLSFKVMWAHGDGNSVTEWEDVDICDECSRKLTAFDVLLRTQGNAPDQGEDNG